MSLVQSQEAGYAIVPTSGSAVVPREAVIAGEQSYPLFDWLRFVLASIVVLVHAGLDVWPLAGNFSVCVFFALSGWLIGAILLRTPAHKLPRFYYNRSTRIWIPYFFAIVLLYTTALLRAGAWTPVYTQVLTYDLTFTHYWFIPKIPEVLSLMPLAGTGTHFWSISVEEQFYIFAPLMLVFVAYFRTMTFWLLALAIALAVDYHYACIAIGVLAAVVRQEYGNWSAGRVSRWIAGGVAIALICTVITRGATYEILAPFAAIAVVLACAHEGARTGIAQFFGGVSFPLYLNHWVGLFMANAATRILDLPKSANIVLALIAAVAVCAILYVAIDRQVMRMRSALFSQRVGKVAMFTAYGLLLVGVSAHVFLFGSLPP